jgi:hypothetical protein
VQKAAQADEVHQQEQMIQLVQEASADLQAVQRYPANKNTKLERIIVEFVLHINGTLNQYFLNAFAENVR